jgi:hypothetical protein
MTAALPPFELVLATSLRARAMLTLVGQGGVLPYPNRGSRYFFLDDFDLPYDFDLLDRASAHFASRGSERPCS